MAESVQPTSEEIDQTSSTPFRDPFGDDPAGIPDPMPDDLTVDKTTSEVADDFEDMEGEAPTS